MQLRFTDIADRIEAVLEGSLSRLDADHWFIEVMDCDGQKKLTFHPAEDESRIRKGTWCLQALDLADEAGNYVISDAELRGALNELRGEQPPTALWDA